MTNSPSIDQIEAKSVHSIYGVVTFCHGLKLEAPVVSSENYLYPSQKQLSETATTVFIETQANALTPATKALPKIHRRVKRIVSNAIKNMTGDILDNSPLAKKSAKQLGQGQKKPEGRK